MYDATRSMSGQLWICVGGSAAMEQGGVGRMEWIRCWFGTGGDEAVSRWPSFRVPGAESPTGVL